MKQLTLLLLLAGVLSPAAVATGMAGDRLPDLHTDEPTLSESGPGAEAAEAEADTLRGWEMLWTAGLHGSQAAYSNWSKGGTSSMSLTSNSLVQLIYTHPHYSYEFRVRSRFGQARIDSEGVRKTDDQIIIRNRFLYDIDRGADRFRLFANVNFETQFARGFQYGAGEDGQDILISDFMAPGYFTQNAGLAWFPDAEFSIEGGLGLKQTIVSDTTLSTRFGLDEGEGFRLEAGLTIGVNYESEIMENIFYRGSLETFTNLGRPIRRTDFAFSNQLTGRINSYVQVFFGLELVFDDDFSNKLQFSQQLSAGVTVQIR